MARVLALWTWYPSVLLGIAGLALGTLWLARWRLTSRSIWFGVGLVVLLMALDSPLDALGDSYLFSAHMLQHLLLILVVPPLLLSGLPAQAAARLLQVKTIERVESWLNHPLVAWWIGIGAVWLWHLPALYNAALANENVHLVEHLSFLIASILFWWPVLSPLEERRMKPIVAVFYLFLGAVANSVLGILLAYASPGTYPAYQNPMDAYGILGLIRSQWGITPALDQQAGGLLMWIAGSPVYLLASLQALSRWYNAPEDQETVFES